jgi:proteasome assembly chaperone 3
LLEITIPIFAEMAAASAPPLPDYTVTAAAYPAHTKTASASVKGRQTTATVVNFADKIFITVTQDGRLAHWVSLSLCYAT